MNYQIFVPSSQVALIYCNGKEVAVSRALMEETRAAVAPLIVERWRAYWQRVAAIAPRKCQAEGVEELTDFIPTMLPSMYYPCPQELAALVEKG